MSVDKYQMGWANQVLAVLALLSKLFPQPGPAAYVIARLAAETLHLLPLRSTKAIRIQRCVGALVTEQRNAYVSYDHAYKTNGKRDACGPGTENSFHRQVGFFPHCLVGSITSAQRHKEKITPSHNHSSWHRQRLKNDEFCCGGRT